MLADIGLEDVTVGYASDIEILRKVTIEVREGRLTGLIGLNGAGKSTLMKTMVGLLPPKEGRVYLNGRDASSIPAHEFILHGVVYIPQESTLFPGMTVEENLWLPLEKLQRARKLSRQEAMERLEHVYAVYPLLKQRRNHAAGGMSGGQQKTLEFAKAHALKPRLCLIDEPSIGLSPKIADEVFESINQFVRSGVGVLLVDHNIRRVVGMCERTYVLSLGEITAAGSQAEMAGDLHDQVKAWLGINLQS